MKIQRKSLLMWVLPLLVQCVFCAEPEFDAKVVRAFCEIARTNGVKEIYFVMGGDGIDPSVDAVVCVNSATHRVFPNLPDPLNPVPSAQKHLEGLSLGWLEFGANASPDKILGVSA